MFTCEGCGSAYSVTSTLSPLAMPIAGSELSSVGYTASLASLP